LPAIVEHHRVIRNVAIHLANEQPLLADLFDLPSASDAGLLCTNVRAPDGKKPVFIDSGTATFFFPYHIVRFLEIPEGSYDPLRARDPKGEPVYAAGPGRRPGTDPQDLLPVVVGGAGGDAPDAEPEVDLEIDEDFLQRIRDI
jgi:hypothetical protein